MLTKSKMLDIASATAYELGFKIEDFDLEYDDSVRFTLQKKRFRMSSAASSCIFLEEINDSLLESTMLCNVLSKLMHRVWKSYDVKPTRY